MSGFEDAIRDLARREGFEVKDSTPVSVEMTCEWSGYSEYTITHQWNQFTVTCGTFNRTYNSGGDLNRGPHDDSDDKGTKSALAKLFDELAGQ